MRREKRRGTHRLLQIGDEVITILVLLQTGEGHLRSGDVLNGAKIGHCVSHRNTLGTGSTHLFGVFEVLEEGVFAPCDTLAHVGGGV